MTIERPMFPPRPDERCQIIQFSQFAAARSTARKGAASPDFAPPALPSARNRRPRSPRLQKS
jgi:hypothetical protein